MLPIGGLGFYSSLYECVRDLDFRYMPAQNLLSRLRKTPGIKLEELEDVGLTDWLAGESGKVSKDQVLELIKSNGPLFVELKKTTDFYPKLNWGEWHYDEDAGCRGISCAEKWTILEQGEAFNIRSPEAIIEGECLLSLEAAFDRAAWLNSSKGQLENSPCYANYSFPGGEAYLELLLVLSRPSHRLFEEDEGEAALDFISEKGIFPEVFENPIVTANRYISEQDAIAFNSSHWEESDVLAHVRLSDRYEGSERILFIEEIQSDWHQTGRRRGYDCYKAIDPDETNPDGSNVEWGEGESWQAALDDARKWVLENEPESASEILPRLEVVAGGVPNAPFKKSWALLAFKRALRLAAEYGHTHIAWSSGQDQLDRYQLRKDVSHIEFSKGNNFINLRAYDESCSQLLQRDGLSMSEVKKLLGQNISERLDLAESMSDWQSMPVGDQKVKLGGEGLKTFYDVTLKNSVKKYIRKLDPECSVKSREFSEGLTSSEWNAWCLPITDLMRQQVLQGQTLYQDEEYDLNLE